MLPSSVAYRETFPFSHFPCLRHSPSQSSTWSQRSPSRAGMPGQGCRGRDAGAAAQPGVLAAGSSLPGALWKAVGVSGTGVNTSRCWSRCQQMALQNTQPAPGQGAPGAPQPERLSPAAGCCAAEPGRERAVPLWVNCSHP